MTHAMRRYCLVAGLFFGGLVPLAAASGIDDAPTTPSAPASSGAYDDAVLREDVLMTQDMSAPTANTDAVFHRADPQLDRSRDTRFVWDLEAYTAQIDQMLARTPR